MTVALASRRSGIESESRRRSVGVGVGVGVAHKTASRQRWVDIASPSCRLRVEVKSKPPCRSVEVEASSRRSGVESESRHRRVGVGVLHATAWRQR